MVLTDQHHAFAVDVQGAPDVRDHFDDLGFDLGRLGLSPKDFRQYANDVSVFSPYTSLANITGQPAISLPLRNDAAGLPSGAMFLARFGEEETLLSLAAALERDLPWAGRRAQFRAG